MKKVITFFLLLTFFSQTLCAVVILVHGTFALHANWCSPGGDFYEELEKQAREINQKIVPFLWSGALGSSAKIRAGHALSKLILSYPDNEEIILIGHSHGGNVINVASQLLNEAEHEERGSIITTVYESLLWTIPFFRQAATDLEEHELQEEEAEKKTIFAESEECESEERIIKNQNYTIVEEYRPESEEVSESENKEEVEMYKNAIESLRNDFQLTRTTSKTYLIKKVFFLGTPVAPKLFSPEMSIIEELYNLYSTSDGIQSVLGLYGTIYEEQERIKNIKVKFKRKNKNKEYSPGHSQLHNPMVATWLLSVPDIIKNRLEKDCFERGDSLGVLSFSRNEPPIFTPTSYRAIDVLLPTNQDQSNNVEGQEAVKVEQHYIHLRELFLVDHALP